MIFWHRSTPARCSLFPTAVNSSAWSRNSRRFLTTRPRTNCLTNLSPADSNSEPRGSDSPADGTRHHDRHSLTQATTAERFSARRWFSFSQCTPYRGDAVYGNSGNWFSSGAEIAARNARAFHPSLIAARMRNERSARYVDMDAGLFPSCRPCCTAYRKLSD